MRSSGLLYALISQSMREARNLYAGGKYENQGGHALAAKNLLLRHQGSGRNAGESDSLAIPASVSASPESG